MSMRTTTDTGTTIPERRPGLIRDASFSAVLAGLIAVLVSYSGPLVIVLSAASAGGLTQARTGSWVWALSIGSGLTCLGLSLYTRMPIVTAWSTPGAALLVTSLGSYPYPEAIGAFLVTGVLITVIGVTGVFGRLMRRVPGMGVLAASGYAPNDRVLIGSTGWCPRCSRRSARTRSTWPRSPRRSVPAPRRTTTLAGAMSRGSRAESST
ncbi:putative benzoate:H+ symporter BenE [Embleya sp. AB8]